MKKTIKQIQILLLSTSLMLIASCQDDFILNEIEEVVASNAQTRTTSPYQFDWENIQFMPTPPGQSIPSPWRNPGRLASIFGIDVLEDRRAADGWELLYSSFNPNATAHLRDPYFVLYNRYRGLMRIFLFTTTSFVAPASFTRDEIEIVSPHNTTLLNFLGQEIINPAARTRVYSSIHQQPLASGIWFMMQYELAFDPNLANIPRNQMLLTWNLQSYSVSRINLVGEMTGTLSSVGVGSSSTANLLRTNGRVVGQGALAGVGLTTLNNNMLDAQGRNTLGIPNHIFRALHTGLNNALASAAGGLPGAAVNILSGVFGGSSAGATASSFRLDTRITLEGTMTNTTSFPSLPNNFQVPGTGFAATAMGRVPLHNRSLGVVNFVQPSRPFGVSVIRGPVWETYCPWNMETLWVNEAALHFTIPNYANYLIINPEVKRVANVRVLEQNLYIQFAQRADWTVLSLNPAPVRWEEWFPRPEKGLFPPAHPGNIERAAVRFVIEVRPHSGAPVSVIYKTFAVINGTIGV